MRTFDANIGQINRLPWPDPLARFHAGLLAFPARLMADLPARVRLEVGDSVGRRLVITTHDGEASALRATGEVAIDGPEWTALAIAAESDRAFASDLAVLLALRGPGLITEDAALAGARPDAPRGWSVGTVLARLGLDLARPGSIATGAAASHDANEEHALPRAA